MATRQLRHFIPLSAPGTRQPAVGNESDFRLSLGFAPGWFHSHLGIDFSERWHKDPVYRYDAMLQMKQYLHGRFPELELFRPKFNENGIESSCATVSGVYGSCPVAAIYGMQVQFRPDRWPEVTGRFTKEQLMQLKPIDVENTPFFQELLGQMEIIEQRYGVIDGYVANQGILNTAFRLMGQEIFLEMMEDEEFAEFLFDHIYQTTLQFVKLLHARQKKSGFDINFMTVSNCVINMVSTGLYEEMLLPYDQKLAKEFDLFGIHTCNWDITRHIDAFKQVGHLGYLDMGMSSEMKKVRAAFPDTRLAVMYHPTSIVEKTLDELRRDFEIIAEQAAPVDLVLADIEANTPDQRLNEVVQMAYALEQAYARR